MILKIEDVLKFGDVLSLKLNVSTQEQVLDLLGNCDEIDENDYSIDYYWDNVCFSFDIKQKTLLKVKIKFEDDTKYKVDFLSEELCFQKEIKLESIFLFLNHLQINFHCVNSEIDFDYLFINTIDNIRITYYLPWSSLIDISLVDGISG
ncbi:MAG: hypothetical protein A3D31_12120 [Candidatus Fluviicola riflensis]|nr:MAG: hypothetical protein CHH17_16555 [Candidatus Fluviicola riflensis]OGS77731.1 MAG: hypothetical protein A3D31_12120 [Candidatus Fluviicola riflensis]OGS84314.1 MAG: hypothetical protein A3E30_13530 [Fluviicola sp. RIFCSPHIGHO2_12_FULL_43_24]